MLLAPRAMDILIDGSIFLYTALAVLCGHEVAWLISLYILSNLSSIGHSLLGLKRDQIPRTQITASAEGNTGVLCIPALFLQVSACFASKCHPDTYA